LCLGIKPLQTNAVLVIDSRLAFSALEFLLGSKRSNAVQIDRELTEIEQNLLDLVFQTMVGEYEKAWSTIAPLEFQIGRMQQQQQAVNAMGVTEPVVATTAELRIDGTTGNIRLALPSLGLQAVWRGLDEQRSRRISSNVPPPAQDRILQLIAGVPLRLDVRLAGGNMLFRSFAAMKPGDVIALGYPVEKTLDCLVNSKLKYKGHVISTGSRLSFQISGYD
jgi:flagellar motor switch protein FliM